MDGPNSQRIKDLVSFNLGYDAPSHALFPIFFIALFPPLVFATGQTALFAAARVCPPTRRGGAVCRRMYIWHVPLHGAG